MRRLAAHQEAEPDGESERQERTQESRIAELERRNAALGEEVEKARRVSRRLLAERDRAREADRTKSMFLAAMSHDLRTPLTAILGFSDLMMNGVFGPVAHSRYQTYIEDIYKSGQLLLGLINNILDLSKISAGKRKLEPRRLDAKTIAEECLALVARATGGRDVTVDILVTGDGTVHADDLGLRQILLNLLSNAVKFTAEGGHVDIAIADGPNEGTAITVTDTGPGMDEDAIRVALAPFGQVAGDRRLAGGGTGLGLPIVVRLIELHGGRFAIVSEPGNGTTVSLWFPPPAAPKM
ncbi:MAG TPA: HAMP domain-containing sensor histidine kinase [Aliidongia sp.]|nr:HAMP domain-containing sensor histidine kinase [Aliidongia sp.]